MHTRTVVNVSCNKDCGAGCPLTAEVQDGRITRITDNAHRGPYMRGCAKGYAMHRLLNHPDRLLRPLMRRGRRGSGSFDAVSWETALNRIAEELHARRERGAVESVMRIGGSGSCRGVVHHTARVAARFLSGLGTYTNTTGNYSSQAASFMKPLLFGRSDIGIDIRTVLESRFIILLGFNPADTRFSCETEKVLEEVKSRGIPAVLVDPRRTASADMCGAEWLPIYPGTDSVLLAALAYEVIASGAVNEAWVARVAEGYQAMDSWLMGKADGVPKNPQWAEGICGIPAQRISQLARRMIKCRPASLLPGLSVQRTLGGEESDRMGLVLQTLLGNVGVRGGSAGCGQWNEGPEIPVPCMSPGIPGSPKPAGVPVYQWAEAVLDRSRRQPISFIYNVGGNFLGQSSNIALVKEALETADFVVTHDHFMTPTCRFSDVVLPATMFLERSDLCTSKSGLLLYSEQAVEPAGETKHDYDICCELARLLGFYHAYSQGRTAHQWVEAALAGLPEGARQSCLEEGYWEIPQRPFVGLSECIASPEDHPLPTASGKIELIPAAYQEMTGSPHPRIQQRICSADYPLFLITPHAKERIHSQKAGSALSADDRLTMHPEDARERGIDDGMRVTVTSEAGSFTAVVKLSDDIMRGVAAKLQGVWPEFAGDGSLLESGAPNMATSTEPTYPSRGSRTHSIAVEVSVR